MESGKALLWARKKRGRTFQDRKLLFSTEKVWWMSQQLYRGLCSDPHTDGLSKVRLLKLQAPHSSTPVPL